MKLLYIGHYKEGSGWSKAAIDSILAADTTGIDIVCRNIKLTNYDSKPNHQIMRLESKNLQDVDYCIQNVLPHHMVGTSKFKKNIGYFVAESNTTLYSGWIENLRLMDEIWVPNHDLRENLINDGLNEKSVKIVPYTFDTLKYTRKYPTVDFKSSSHKFKFYFIGELNDRKNLESIIRCFHSEFENYEPVALVLKVKRLGMSRSDIEEYMNQLCGQVKKELRIYKNISDYIPEIIISDDVSDDDIQALHSTCDCFVGPTHGEGWSIPAFDAMAHGKTPICSNEGGPKDFISSNHKKDIGWLINGTYNICNHSNPAFPELFTGKELWFSPSEQEIKRAMRFYYENRESIDRTAGLKQAEKFSYVNVGKIMESALND